MRAQLKKTADPLISKDEKARLNDEFKQKVNSAVQRENSGMYGNSETADWIKRFDFMVSRRQAFAGVRGWPKRHRFDGSGYWIFRFGRNGSGKKWKELFKPATTSRFTLLDKACGQIKGQNRGLRHVVRGTVILSGEAKEKAHREKNKIGFSIILHRPIPEDAIIRNAQIVKQRSGKNFQYYVCFNCDLAPTRRKETISDVTIGIDTGWRIIEEMKNQPKNSLRDYGRQIQVATIAFSDARKDYAEICFPERLARKARHLLEIQSDLDKSATRFGKQILPLVKGVTIADDYPGKQHEIEAKKRFLEGLKLIGGNITLDIERAYKFAKWVQFASFEGNERYDIFDSKLKALCHDWLYSIDKGSKRTNKAGKVAYYSRYREMHGLRKHITIARNELYRTIASDLVKGTGRVIPELRALEDGNNYRVIVEKLSLHKMAEKKYAHNALSDRALAVRQLVAPGTFLSSIEMAANREKIDFLRVDPRDTSKTCSSCNYKNDIKSEKTWQCSNCNVWHDLDRNAAINIARRGLKKTKK